MRNIVLVCLVIATVATLLVLGIEIYSVDPVTVVIPELIHR